MVVIGSGGHSRVILDLAKAIDIGITNIYDDDSLKSNLKFLGHEIIVPVPMIIAGKAFIAIGNNSIRKSFSESLLNVSWVTLIHPSATIASDVIIGEGTVVMAGSIIQPGTRIGKHCIINTGACIDHNCVIGDFVHVAPNSSLAGGVSIGEGTFVGIGACLIPNVSIGEWTIIGAGSVVIDNQPSMYLIFGTPAKPVKLINREH